MATRPELVCCSVSMVVVVSHENCKLHMMQYTLYSSHVCLLVWCWSSDPLLPCAWLAEHRWLLCLSCSVRNRHCTNLRYLSIGFCTNFTSRGLHYLLVGKGCKKVTYLDMSGCEQVHYRTKGLMAMCQVTYVCTYVRTCSYCLFVVTFTKIRIFLNMHTCVCIFQPKNIWKGQFLRMSSVWFINCFTMLSVNVVDQWCT